MEDEKGLQTSAETLTNTEKWDKFAWSNEPVTRKYKVSQYVNGSCVSRQGLLTYRVFATLGIWMQMTFSWYWDLAHLHASELKYFTEWGKYMTLFTMTLLCMGSIWYKPGQDPYSTEPMMMWKWCSWIFTMCFWWETVITIVFWGFLLPHTAFLD